MNYRIILFFLLMTSCVTENIEKSIDNKFNQKFTNKGFALISDSIEKKSLIIFQKNLPENTKVKITNLSNNKSIVVIVGEDINYPNFYNSLISKKLANDLDLDNEEPYIQIDKINESSIFLAKKAKTFDEEKKVADKAPVEDVSIISLNKKSKKNKYINKKKDFNYLIKIADFYFKDSAILMKNRIINETNTSDVNILKINKNSHRVYLGPYKNLDSLKIAFDAISKLNFENIEFLKQ